MTRFQKISRHLHQLYTSVYINIHQFLLSQKIRSIILKHVHENLYDTEKVYELEI